MKVASTIGGEAKIPVRNIWYLLLYAWDLADWKGRFKSQAETAPNLLALLASVLAASVRDLLRTQLGRTFLTHHETIRGIRGRLDLAESLKRMTFLAGRAHCSFSQLDVDTIRNRILKATIARLARDENLGSAGSKQTAELRTELRALLRALEGVQLVPISSADFSRLQLGRNDRSYAVPLAICRLLHKLQVPTESVGDSAIVALLTDELRMSSVYETFLRNFYRRHLTGHKVTSEKLSWCEQPTSAYMPEMRTDITITAAPPTNRRLVIDAKFSGSTLTATPHGALKFKSANLYQLYTYLRTQEHRGEAFRVAEGLLLYPTVNVEVMESVVLDGHRIQIATVDLSRDWEAIEQRLVAIASAEA